MHISYAHAVRGLFPDDLGAAYLPNVFRLQAAMTAEDEYATSLLAITELLKYGTTTFIDPGTYYLSRRRHRRLSGVGVPHHRRAQRTGQGQPVEPAGV